MSGWLYFVQSLYIFITSINLTLNMREPSYPS